MLKGIWMTPSRVDNILQLVGNTPLIRINRMNPAPNVELLVKLESMNPGGSVKDRIALRMIEEAEATGALAPGKIVLEASSGNTAIGLAMVCAVKGYHLLVTMSESASEERRRILRAYGAEILLTPGHLSTDGAIEEAYRLAREEPNKYFLVDQFNNDANWHAHCDGTGQEIWDATEGKVDVVVITMGTTGTLMGATRALRKLNPKVRVVGVEPFQGHKLQGLKNMKESYPPGVFQPDEPDAIVNVEDDASYEMARRLAREEGIFVGMSAGAAMKVAVDEALALENGVVVTLLADGGERYLSTSLFVSETVPEPLRFHNTLSGNVEELQPTKPGKVTIYTCGPSLEGRPDLAVCRRVVFSDVLRRYLEYRGYDVKHAMNLGDIDDRTVNECINVGEELRDFTAKWENVFFDDMTALGVLTPHHCPRASEHIDDMIDQTRNLLDKGLAYEKLRSVYYRIEQFPEYGRLSGIEPDQMRSEASTTYDYYDKDHPQDFALFKRSTLAELKAGIFWKTPWGNARPGWHVECSSMAVKYLGQPIDIHTASTNLTFPHGDNEIAIACGLHSQPLANIWMHSEVVMSEGKKVSRAAGNDVTLGDLTVAGFDGPTIRYWLLATHYRTVLKYSSAELESARRSVSRLNEFVARLNAHQPGERSEDFDQALYEARTGCQDAMDSDLNTAQALGRIFTFVRHANKSMDDGHLDAEQVQQSLGFMQQVNRILDVIQFTQPPSDAEIERLLAERDDARQRKDFAKADLLRDELRTLGVELVDGPGRTRWKKT
jgi:cysteinyl-tRNA synthetase